MKCDTCLTLFATEHATLDNSWNKFMYRDYFNVKCVVAVL